MEKADKKDNEDLRAFELLEEAALDSSFCSNSSTVKKLMEGQVLPSPIPKRYDSSTPKEKFKQGTNKFNIISQKYLPAYISNFIKLSS